MTIKHHKIKKANTGKKVSQYLIQLDESFREIAALDELYDDIVNSNVGNKKKADMRCDEAKFARDRLLRLSLHVKHLIAEVEKEEQVKPRNRGKH